MSTWQSLAGYKGYYESAPIHVSFEGDAALSKILWDASSNNMTDVKVYTLLSHDNINWSEWKVATNGGEIPDVSVYSNFGSFYLKFRVFLGTLDYQETPLFESIQFEFEPVVVFENKGGSICKPEIWITKVGNGDFSLVNISNGNETFAFTGLIDGETLYVNNENEDIETSLVNTYRYSNFNENFLNLPIGHNVFRVLGEAKFQFRYQFRLM